MGMHQFEKFPNDFLLMPSQLRMDNAEDEGKTVMNHNAPVKKSSLQHETCRIPKGKVSRESKGRLLSPRGNRSMKLQDKGRPLKSGKPIEQSGSDQQAAAAGKIGVVNSVPPMALGNCHKPWPNTKVAGVEEVIKYMSNVPSYLQCSERGDNVQEKALNFGVLDWGRLERWTYKQKRVSNGRSSVCPSSSNASSSYSTFSSSSQSCGSNGSSLPQMKQSPATDGHQNLSAGGCQTKRNGEEQSRNTTGFSNSRDSRESTEGMSTEKSHEKDVRKDSDKGPSFGKFQLPDIGNSTSTDVFAFARNKVKSQIARSGGAEIISEHQRCPGGMHLVGNWLQEQCSAARVRWDHLQECDTVLNNGRPDEVNHNNYSEKCPHEGALFTNLSPQIPYSCPLPSTAESVKPDIANPPTTKSKGKHEKHDQTTSSEQFVVNKADRSGEDEIKATAAQPREQSSHNQLGAHLNWLSRSSSLKEGSSAQQMEENSCSDNSSHDKATANGRGRQSPLKRILEPLLKSKNRLHYSGPITSSYTDKLPISEELASARESCKLSDASINSSASQETNFHSSVKEERNVASTRQAVLKLAWKNGLPFLMLSSDDNNILAATMGKRNGSSKNDLECIYTIFGAQEVNKKSGIRIRQGNKGKKHGLAYNVVGQMKVSHTNFTKYGSDSHFAMREFVLFGAELIPTTHQNKINSLFNNELAAIIVKVPNGRQENSKGDLLHSSNYKNSSCENSGEDKFSCCQVGNLQTEQDPEGSNLSSVVVILPCGVHGFSSSGEPSPLIERWKSGGSCDCGGWDEGCMLTILTDKVREVNSGSVQACQTTGGTHRIQLFIQGGAREKRHVFRMIAFKEGLYTVDFGASIALLQAFAICIATLHSRKLTDCSELHHSVETKSLHEQIFADYTRMAPARSPGGVPASYVPYHPPPSPVGRA